MAANLSLGRLTGAPRLVCACYFLLLLAGTASAANISGTVSDADSKVPLPAMVAAAYTAAGILQATATTDSFGGYTLVVPAGAYRILAYDPSGVYATAYGNDADSFETSPVVNGSAASSDNNFALHRAGFVRGTVATSSATPLAGMTVAAYNLITGTRRGFTQTAGNGTYSLLLPPGQYKIAAYDDAGIYAVRFYQDQASFVAANPVLVTGGNSTSGFDFQLAAAGHLSGTIVDADTNLILPGKMVIAYAPDGTAIANRTADLSANFSFALPPGSYKLVAVDTAFVYAAGFLDDANSFANEAAISVVPTQTVNNLRMPLHRGGNVTGHVTNAASNTGLAGITVAAYNDDGTQRGAIQSDDSGAYSLLLPQGSFRIAAFDTLLIFATQFYPATNLFSDANRIPLFAGQTTLAIDFGLVRGARFVGTITDQVSGMPISGISITAYDDGGNSLTTATSDASGNYALIVPAGSYRLVASDSGLHYPTTYGGGAPNFETATVYQTEGSSSHHLDFSLTRGVRVSGKVVDSNAAFVPISGIQIGALDVMGNRVATATTKDGVFELVLLPGTYKFLATDPLHRFYTTFYNTAWTLTTATPVTVSSNGTNVPVTLLLVRVERRRAGPH